MGQDRSQLDLKVQSPDADVATTVAEVQELVWALVDGQLPEVDRIRLAQLLTHSESARQEYLRCVGLHAGLHEVFACDSCKATSSRASTVSPILGFLKVPGEPLDAGLAPPTT